MATAERFRRERGGACSFCGKAAQQVHSVIAARISHAQICNECIDLCTGILAEERPHASGRASQRDRNGNPPTDAFVCSFCGNPRGETNVLIAGPRVFICGYCAGDVAALLE